MTSAQPLVSVIIPTYNRAHILPRSLVSVLGQTYANIEVLVIDDGSADDTETVIKNINDDRVRYIKSPVNAGPAAARNRGASLAAGDIIAFQDSDDEWPADKLEKQITLLLKDSSAQLVYCRFDRYNGDQLLNVTPPDSIPLEQKQGDMLLTLLNTPLIGTPTVVVWKERFLELGGFNESLHSFEDYEFSLRFAEKYRIAFAEDTFVKVHVSPGGVGGRYAEGVKTDMYIVKEMIDHLRRYDMLIKRVALVHKRAVLADCYEVFCEELKQCFSVFTPAEQAVIQESILDGNLKQYYDLKKTVYYTLQHIAGVVKTLQDQYAGTPGLLNDPATSQAMQKVAGALSDCIGVLNLEDAALNQKIYAIKEKMCSDESEKTEILTELYSLVTLMQEQVYTDMIS